MHRFPSRSAFLLVVVILLWSPVTADPQTYFLNIYCSRYNVTDPSNFAATLNATFAYIRSALSNALYATTDQRPRAVFQCLPYLSFADCIACFSVAEARIRQCGAAKGAYVSYDGCRLSYVRQAVFNATAVGSSRPICGRNSSSATGFSDAAKNMLSDLKNLALKTKGFFAEMDSNDVYGVAQCAVRATFQECAECLDKGLENIKSCPPAVDGRAVAAACFIRYSNKLFFPKKSLTTLSTSVGKTSKMGIKGIIKIVGCVVGSVVLVAGAVLGGQRWIKGSRDGQSLRKGCYSVRRRGVKRCRAILWVVAHLAKAGLRCHSRAMEMRRKLITCPLYS